MKAFGRYDSVRDMVHDLSPKKFARKVDRRLAAKRFKQGRTMGSIANEFGVTQTEERE